MSGSMEGEKLELKQQTITEEISKINVSSSLDDITLVPTDAKEIKVSYYYSDDWNYEMTTENKTLEIKEIPFDKSDKKWYEYVLNVDMNTKYRGIVIEIPKSKKYEMDLSANLGDIEVHDLQGTVTAKAEMGDIKIAGGTFTSVKCENNLGDVDITCTKAESIDVKLEKGDIEFENTTGNITASCTLGDIDFENITSDKIVLENDKGDISGSINGLEEEYTVISETNLGDNNLIGNYGNGSKTLKANTSFGDIEIYFRP